MSALKIPKNLLENTYARDSFIQAGGLQLYQNRNSGTVFSLLILGNLDVLNLFIEYLRATGSTYNSASLGICLTDVNT